MYVLHQSLLHHLRGWSINHQVIIEMVIVGSKRRS